MSVRVPLGELAAAVQTRPYGYLLSVGESGAVKAVTIAPTLQAGALVAEEPGRGSCDNVAARPAVTVLFPPTDPGGYSLIVDGAGSVDGEAVLVAPTSAVLHRPADHAETTHLSASTGGGDCHPL